MRKLLASLLLLCVCLPQTHAQEADSSAFRPSQLIAPGVLVASSMGIHFFAHDSWDASVQQWAQELRNGKDVPRFDDWLQYSPYALDLGLGLVGVSAKHDFFDRTMEAALACAVGAGVSWTSKRLFHTLRPNGKNYRSFPSGHSTTVFLGAELVRMEYGWGWGAGAYTVALTVGSMRIYRNWHWFSDVLFGAGIGILSAHAGEWLLQPAKNVLGIKEEAKVNLTLATSYDPFSGTLGSSLTVLF